MNLIDTEVLIQEINRIYNNELLNSTGLECGEVESWNNGFETAIDRVLDAIQESPKISSEPVDISYKSGIAKINGEEVPFNGGNLRIIILPKED